MFFTENDLNISILDVMDFKSDKKKANNSARNFSALSLRTRSDSVVSWNGKRISLKDGALTYFPPGLQYRRECKYDELTVVHFDLTNYKYYDIQSVMPSDPHRYDKEFQKLLMVWTQKKAGYKYAAHAILYGILEKAYNEFSGSAEAPPAISNAINYIHEHYTEKELSVSKLSEISGISEVYFRKLFKEHFGITPKKYITDLRIENAKALLNSGDITVVEAAERSGFYDAKYFSTVYKEKTGSSPSKQKYIFS